VIEMRSVYWTLTLADDPAKIETKTLWLVPLHVRSHHGICGYI